MTIVANSYRHVIGIDTHARTHTLVVIDAATGARLRSASFAATGAGLVRAISFITHTTTAIVTTLVAIEGVGSFGARIAHECTAAGFRVVEPMPTPKGLRAGRGKSDPIDAELIARSVLAVDLTRLRDPRHDHGIRAAIRVLIAGREHLNAQRTATINALTALVRTADLGVDARRPLTSVQIVSLASTRMRKEDIAIAVARGEARRMTRQRSIQRVTQRLEQPTAAATCACFQPARCRSVISRFPRGVRRTLALGHRSRCHQPHGRVHLVSDNALVQIVMAWRTAAARWLVARLS